MGRNTMTHYILLFILFVFSMSITNAQESEKPEPKVYKVNKAIEIPVTVALFGAQYFGFNYINSKPTLSEEELTALNPDNIWKFDRRATQQDPSYTSQAGKISDIVMNVSVVLPGFLAFDRRMRHDWLDLLTLYGETHAVNTSVYLLHTMFIDRYRPLVYNEGVPLEERMGQGTRNSFFSGHVSTTATSTFFAAKVYSDYHPELGAKKFWLFGAAVLPPLVVGIYRVKAMKHFPTDVIMGGLVGAASGILVPHFHKRRDGKNDLSVVPFFGNMNGMTIRYAIR